MPEVRITNDHELRGSDYTMIPLSLITDKRVRGTALSIALYVLSFDAGTFLTLPSIADWCGLSEASVRSAVRLLEQTGYMVRHGDGAIVMSATSTQDAL